MATQAEKIDKMADNIEDVKTMVSGVDKKLDLHLEGHKSSDQMLHDHDKMLEGNGKDGLDMRVDRLENVVNFVKWATGIIAGTVMADFVLRIIGLVAK